MPRGDSHAKLSEAELACGKVMYMFITGMHIYAHEIHSAGIAYWSDSIPCPLMTQVGIFESIIYLSAGCN